MTNGNPLKLQLHLTFQSMATSATERPNLTPNSNSKVPQLREDALVAQGLHVIWAPLLSSAPPIPTGSIPKTAPKATGGFHQEFLASW